MCNIVVPITDTLTSQRVPAPTQPTLRWTTSTSQKHHAWRHSTKWNQEEINTSRKASSKSKVTQHYSGSLN